MSDLVERMAREMFEENMTLCQPELGFKHDEHWDTTPELNRKMWRKVARAGLGAIREPTDAMVWPDLDQDDRQLVKLFEAGKLDSCPAHGAYFEYHRNDDAAGIWRAFV